MLKNIFLTSLRHLLRNKIYSLTIILSLGIGFTVSNLLVAFTVHELKTDSFFENRKRIFRVISDDPFDQGHKLSFVSKKFADYLPDQYAGITASTLMYTVNHRGLSDPEKNSKLENLIVLGVDSAFLEIFDFSLQNGSMDNPVRPGHIILTEETAVKLSDAKNPVGKMVDLVIDTGNLTLMVSGILDKPADNSHLDFDALVFFDDFEKLWGGIIYVLLANGTDPSELEATINRDGNTPDLMGQGKVNYYFQDLGKVYFDENNTRSFSKARDEMFIWVSWTVTFLVLFLAGFNFINLFFISFRGRWKEIGMKKVLGASPFVFRATAFIEAALYLGLSLVLSFGLIYRLLPFFNDLIGTDLTLPYFFNSEIILLSAGLLLIIAGLVIIKITGYLLREKPVSLITHDKLRKIRVNQLMLYIQFVISVTLIMVAIAMIRQISYIREKPLGFNKNLLEIRLPGNLSGPDPSVLKNKVAAVQGVQSVSVCSGNPVSDNMIARYDLEDGTYYTPYIYYGDEDYLQTLGLNLLAGNIPAVTSAEGKLVNEAFLRRFDITNANSSIGSRIPGTEQEYIAGVVKDFNIASLKMSIPPAIISQSGDASILLIKFDPQHLPDLIPGIESTWKGLYGDQPFRYLWVDEEISKTHRDDQLFSRIIIASSIISILISCFGLFALSWGTSIDRSREIGIRKVMGASSGGIFLMLSGYYFKRILVAFLLSVPLAAYLIDWWLEKFVYKISISFTLFTAAAVVTGTITLFSILYQTVRSSRINPVKILKFE